MEQIQSKKKDIVWVNMLKGIAIILVVVGHNTVGHISRFVYCFHMPLFFMVSGFLFSYKPLRIYFNKSLQRLLVPYMCFLLLILTIDALMSQSTGISITLGGGNRLIINTLYGGTRLTGSYGVFWFITVLFISANIFNLFLRIRLNIVFLPIFIVLGYCLSYFYKPLPLDINVVPMAISYMWIGYLLRNPYNNITSKPGKKSTGYNKQIFLFLSILVLTLTYIFNDTLRIDMKYCKYGLLGVSLISSILCSIAIAYITIQLSNYNFIAVTLSFIGVTSMIIMYAHLPVKYLLLPTFGINNSGLVAMLIEIITSLILYLIVIRHRLARKLLLGS